MPCNCDHLQHSGNELESKRVCELLVYLYEKTGRAVELWIKDGAENYYGNVNRLDEATALLCGICRTLSDEETEEYIYNAKSKRSRRLANWWETHQEWDERRVKEEQAAKKRTEARKSGYNKLTDEERKALDLVEPIKKETTGLSKRSYLIDRDNM